MNVGIDVYQAGVRYGGIARYIRALVSALIGAAPADRFVLVSNHWRAPDYAWRPQAENVRHVTLRAPRRLMQACWDRFAWPPIEAVAGPLDIFHGTHFVLPAAARAKLVLTVHDLNFLRHPEYFLDRSLNERGHRIELAAALRRADVVIAVSQHTKRDVVELMGVPEARVRVVYEGAEPQMFVAPSVDVPAVRHRFGLDRPYLVFLVGTPEPRKNLERTVAAARAAAPDLPLAIIGPPDPIRRLLNGELRGVRLLGSVSDDDLPAVLHGADVALYPSLAEGFGLPAIEALAAGVPLVTSNRTSLPEVVGDAAELVDPESVEAIAQGIRAVLGDAARRRHLIERGQARARALTWDRAAGDVLALYRELAG